MMYALLSVFVAGCYFESGAEIPGGISALPLKGIFQGIKLIGAILVGILMILAVDWSVASDSDQRSWCNGCRADVGFERSDSGLVAGIQLPRTIC